MSATAFRWLEASISLPLSFMRWPRLFSSYFSLTAPRRGWLGEVLDFSVFDTLLWPLISAVESVALVSMLCFFFLFCGCTF